MASQAPRTGRLERRTSERGFKEKKKGKEEKQGKETVPYIPIRSSPGLLTSRISRAPRGNPKDILLDPRRFGSGGCADLDRPALPADERLSRRPRPYADPGH